MLRLSLLAALLLTPCAMDLPRDPDPVAKARAAGYRVTRTDRSTFLVITYEKAGMTYQWMRWPDYKVTEDQQDDVKSIECLDATGWKAATDRTTRLAATEAKAAAAAGRVAPPPSVDGGIPAEVARPGKHAPVRSQIYYALTNSKGETYRIEGYEKKGVIYRISHIDGSVTMLYQDSVKDVRRLSYEESLAMGGPSPATSSLSQGYADSLARTSARWSARTTARTAARSSGGFGESSDGGFGEGFGWAGTTSSSIGRSGSIRGTSSSTYSGSSGTSRGRSGGYYTGPRQPSGHYAGGVGSSHSGGHYMNSATNNHYQRRH